MQIGKPQPGAASDHQIRTVAMQLANSMAPEGASSAEIIERAQEFTLYIKFGTIPAKNPNQHSE